MEHVAKKLALHEYDQSNNKKESFSYVSKTAF